MEAGIGHGARPLERFRGIISGQLGRRPVMEAEDLYKLCYQAAMGSSHAVTDEEGAAGWLVDEMSRMGEGPEDPLVEPICPWGGMVRVNLRPLREAGLDPLPVLRGFLRTSWEHRGEPERLRLMLRWLLAMQGEGKLPRSSEGLPGLVREMERQELPAVHHGSAYREAFRPAYRVVAVAFLPEALKDRLPPWYRRRTHG